MKKRNILILLSSVSVLLIGSIAGSVAWYESMRDVEVSQVDISLKTDYKLQLSTSGEDGTFYDKLDVNESDENGLQKISIFKPVSSMFSSQWIENKSEKPIFKDSYNGFVRDAHTGEPSISNATNEFGYGFYSQDIYLTCDENFYITIDSESEETFFTPDIEFNKKSAKRNLPKYKYMTSEEEMESHLNDIVKSLRCSILYIDEEGNYNYWIIDPYKDKDTIFGGPLDTGFVASHVSEDYPSGFYNSYKNTARNRFEEICFGEIYDRSLLIYNDTPEQENSTLFGTPSTFNARHEKGVHRLNWEASKNVLLEANAVKVEDSITLKEAENEVLLPVYAYQNTKIVLSFYLEGWDLDNINETMDAGFNIGLSFKMVPGPGPKRN